MRLSWTERSLADLDGIDRWLTENVDSAFAERQIEQIRVRARRLRDFPRIGPQVNEEWRSVIISRTPYLLIYRIDHDAVQILRIRHQRENWRLPE